MMAFHRFSSITVFLGVMLAPQWTKAQGDDNVLFNAKPINPQGHLLWFNGHFSPTNKNLFIIDKDSATKGGGGTITVKPGGEIQVNSPGGDEWNKKVDDALNSITDWEKKLDDPKSNTDPTSFHLNTLLKEDAEASKEEWKSYKIDTKQDILSTSSQMDQNVSSNQGSLSSNAAGYCNSIKAQYDEIISFYEAHKKDKEKDLQYTAPPQLEHTCYACDSNKQKEYDTIIKHYTDNFFQPEYRLCANALKILHDFNLMGVQSDFGSAGAKIALPELEGLFNTDKKDPSKSGACSFVDFYKLYDAVRFLAMRGYDKADKMFHDHKKDWKAAEAIARTVVESERNVILLTGNNAMEDNVIQELIPLIDQSFEYYYGILLHNDWTQIGNLVFIIGQLRNEAMLGANMDKFDDFLQRITQIVNGFELTIEMDVKIGKDGGYHLAHLKGKCNVIPDFVRDSNQCYKWVVADDQLKDAAGFFKSKLSQSIDCNVITNEFVTQSGPRPVYIGTKKYITNLSALHMDFCNPGKDSIILSSFIPNPQENGTWQFPMGVKADAGIMGSEQNFKSLDQLKQLASSGQAQTAADQMKAQAEKLKAQMQNVASQLKSGKASLQDYQKILELSQKAKDVSNNQSVAPIIYIDFEIPVQNKDREIINKKFDARQINPRLQDVIIYGYYTIHLENKANPQPKTPATPPKK